MSRPLYNDFLQPNTSMIIGAIKESELGEHRVAVTPNSVKKIINLGYDVVVQSGCGREASFHDSMYESAGAKVLPDQKSVLGRSDIVLKVDLPSLNEINDIQEGATLISFVWPAKSESELDLLRRRDVTTLAMDWPRIFAPSLAALSYSATS